MERGGAKLEVAGLSARRGAFDVLDDVSFTLAPGELCAVLGPNGGGKTTLLQCILGLLAPARGAVLIDGVPAARADSAQLSYVPQLKTLDRSFPALAAELVLSGVKRRWSWRLGAADLQLARSALALVGAEPLTLRSAGQLSGGELQRVYLARALARRPRLILLDEPASGVDVAGEADFHHVLDDYRRQSGATVLMVTHDWGGSLHHADQVLLLNRRQLAFGSPAEALSDRVLRDAFGHHGHSHGMGWSTSHAETRSRGE